MIWHVPNLTPIKDLSSAAFLKYYTNNDFLDDYGGTMQTLYANYAPLVHAGKYINNNAGYKDILHHSMQKYPH